MKRLRHAANPPRFASDPQPRGGSELADHHDHGQLKASTIHRPDVSGEPGKFANGQRLIEKCD